MWVFKFYNNFWLFHSAVPSAYIYLKMNDGRREKEENLRILFPSLNSNAIAVWITVPSIPPVYEHHLFSISSRINACPIVSGNKWNLDFLSFGNLENGYSKFFFFSELTFNFCASPCYFLLLGKFSRSKICYYLFFLAICSVKLSIFIKHLKGCLIQKSKDLKS